MALALSTSWVATSLDHPRQLIKALDQFEVRAVELEYRLSAGLFQAIAEALRRSQIQVTSLHNFCPYPALLPGAAPSGDYFRLSALDDEERALAVQWTQNTLQHAHDVEAGCVVLHCGAVEMPDKSQRILNQLQAADTDDHGVREMIAREMTQRAKRAAPYVDALLFSLDKLMPAAEKYHIKLGVENRFHYFELPGFEEIDVILSEFRGGPIGYWHDCGHAHASEVMGIVDQEQLLHRYGSDILGFHLHDAVGVNDHKAPGSGEIDFSILKNYFDPSRPVVIELAAGTTELDIRQGIAFTRDLCGPECEDENTDFSLDLPDDFF